MASEWDSLTKDAMKILGEKAKVPKWSPTIDKAEAADNKTFDAFDKTRDELKAKLLATQNSRAALKDAVSQFQDQIDESNFGLDPKSKDDAKKIADARKLLSGSLDEKLKTFDTDAKNFKELDRHLMSLMNYKQGE